MNRIGDSFQRWWFECEPVWWKGLLRALGVVMLLDAVRMLTFYGDFFTDEGVVTAASLKRMMAGRGEWNVFSLLPAGSDVFAWSMMAIYLASLIFLIRGRHPRLWCAATFLCTSYFRYRFSYVEHGGYSVARLLLLGGIFAPPVPAGIWGGVVGWGPRFIQLQVSLIYLTNAICKLAGTEWRNGSALYYVGRSTDFHRLNFAWLFDNHLLTMLMSLSLPWFYILVSAGLWWRRTRPLCLIFVILLHLMIDLTMVVPGFGPTMVIGALFFVTGKDLVLWRSWLSKMKQFRFRRA